MEERSDTFIGINGVGADIGQARNPKSGEGHSQESLRSRSA